MEDVDHMRKRFSTLLLTFSLPITGIEIEYFSL